MARVDRDPGQPRLQRVGVAELVDPRTGLEIDVVNDVRRIRDADEGATDGLEPPASEAEPTVELEPVKARGVVVGRNAREKQSPANLHVASQSRVRGRLLQGDRSTQAANAFLRNEVALATMTAPTSVAPADTPNIPGIVSTAATCPPSTEPRIAPIANAVPEKSPWAVA